jgi:hypothetical protein
MVQWVEGSTTHFSGQRFFIPNGLRQHRCMAFVFWWAEAQKKSHSQEKGVTLRLHVVFRGGKNSVRRTISNPAF